MTRITEVAFFDAGLPGLDVVLDGVRPGVEAVLVGGRTPVAAQIAGALNGRSGLAAIHVMAHGAPGIVDLGRDTLTAEWVRQSGGRLAAVGAALAAEGRLLVWSCGSGAGARGAALVAALSEATGAAVLASIDLIGAPTLGGRWDIDGTAAEPPITMPARAAYGAVLSAAARQEGGAGRARGAQLRQGCGPLSPPARPRHGGAGMPHSAGSAPA